MSVNDLPQGEKYIKNRLFHKRWHKVLLVLSALAVFCTAYALARPAVTMERDCPIPEHVHSDACYTQLAGETASAEGVSADPEELTCTNTDEGHVHTARCYGTWVLTCGVEEHVHTSACRSGTEEDPASGPAPDAAVQSAAGTLNVSLLYGDQKQQSDHPDGVSYFTHTNMSGYSISGITFTPRAWAYFSNSTTSARV